MLSTHAVFVDRDGTLIREVGYLARQDQIELLPRVPEAIRLLQSHGLKVVMITNQSAVARGIINEQQLHKIHREIVIVLTIPRKALTPTESRVDAVNRSLAWWNGHVWIWDWIRVSPMSLGIR